MRLCDKLLSQVSVMLSNFVFKKENIMINNYTSTFTGENFLYFETKIIIKLILEGLTDKEIKKKILSENTFQYKTIKRAGRRITDIIKRLKNFDRSFLEIFNSSSNEEGRILNLFIIYENNKLLSDFMKEVIKEKYDIQQYILTDPDIKNFFNKKAQTDENVRSWKEYTIYKLSQVLRKILIESGILIKNNEYKLTVPFLSEDLKNIFIERNAEIFLECIGIKTYK
jgi:hypothetical protein